MYWCGMLNKVVILTVFVTVTSKDIEKCNDGKFGINCYFECHCLDNKCAPNGSCLGVDCQEGWSGSTCQKRNIALHSKNVTQSPYITQSANNAIDGNTSTYSETFGSRPYLYVDYGNQVKIDSLTVRYLFASRRKICLTNTVENIGNRTAFEKTAPTCYYAYRSPRTYTSLPLTRFIVIYPRSDKPDVMMVSEIEASKNLVAPGRAHMKPTPSNNHLARLAIDSSRYTYAESSGTNTIWMVDMGRMCTFTSINVKLKTYYGRKEYQLYIGNSTQIFDGLPDNSSVKYSKWYRRSRTTEWKIQTKTPVIGQYITVLKKGSGSLKIYDVKALEKLIPVAAKQSPYEHPFKADFAVDGSKATFSQTYGLHPYLSIDVGNITEMSSVSLDIELKDKNYEICVSNNSELYKYGNSKASPTDQCWNNTHLNSTWELLNPGSARYMSLTSPGEGFLTLKELEVFTCNKGTYGDDCELQCDICGNYSCNGITGKCLGGCAYGWFGQNCTLECPKDCVCNGSRDECDACEAGWFGTLCEKSCSNNCSQGCLKDTGVCLACAPGLFGESCTQTCSDKCNNVTSCERNSGDCVKCRNGYYGNKCEDACPASCNSSGCDKQSGECLTCNSGYYGKNCLFKCPKNCNDLGCDKETGLCKGCVLGFAGVSCMVSCNNTLSSCIQCTKDARCTMDCPDTCNEQKCNKTSGKCMSCNTGFYGNFCDMKCPEKCDERGCYQNGTCNNCIKGFYGTNCSLQCSKYCDNLDCERKTGDCSSCKDGYFGKFCSQKCPDNCGNNGCNKDNRLCFSCKNGYYGRSCDNTCSANCDRRGCEISSGSCFACKSGYFGTKCTQKCSSNCDNYGCVFENGYCFGCKQGYFGSTCNGACPYSCSSQGCIKDSGVCYSCKSGYFGDKCQQGCPKRCTNGKCTKISGKCMGCQGYFHGTNCNNPCPKNCNNKGCDFQSGVCYGCVDAYFGNFCNQSCSIHCDERGCSMVTGKCISCRIGYYGNKCNSRCSNKCNKQVCLQTSGKCASCSFGHYGDDCKIQCPENCDNKGCETESGNCFGCVNGFHGDKCNKVCSNDCDDKGCTMSTGTCWSMKKNISEAPKAVPQTLKQAQEFGQMDYGELLGPILGVIFMTTLVIVSVIVLGIYCNQKKTAGSKYKRFEDDTVDNPTFNCETLEISPPIKDVTV